MKRLFIALIMVLSITTAFAQNITNAEYFFDHDPGPGSGIPVSVGTPAPAVNFTAAIPVNLSPGFHWLGVRTKDSNGKWGLFDRRDFYIGQTTTDMPIITAAEYFYDHDPGVGNGTAVTIINPGFAVSQIFSIPVPASMSGGTHQLAIRVKDQAGHWALYMKDSIVVAGIVTISCPGNTTVSAAAGQCTAVVNNIDPIISQQGAAYTYTLTGATTGNGNGSASGHAFNAGVTTVTYALSSSPTTNCSFTVTVNTNVAPSVSIVASASTICFGTQVTFTATPTNGGSTPNYVWKVNGVNAAINSSTYQSSILANGDVVTAVMTSSLGCANPASATSNAITMSVSSAVTPSVSITASSTDICQGTQVTFTATPSGGGATPSYQWKKNGANVGSNSPTYQNSTFYDGDYVWAIMTSSLACADPDTATSNRIMIGVTAPSVPSVSISASSTTICPGTKVTFTAFGLSGGSPSYQWKKNGNNVGTNSPIYKDSTLQNGDSVKVIMTSSLSCVTQSTATSNTIGITVGQTAPVSVSIGASETTICSGTEVIFTATPTNEGSTPSYQWKLNGNNVGTNSPTYQNSALQNGDLVKVILTSSLACASQPTATSNSITMSVGQTVTPSVTIAASATTICPGTLITFTATPTNGGNAPHYQWRINGNSVGSDSPTYQTSTMQNGDSIVVYMGPSLSCVTQDLVLSNSIFITVSQSVIPSVSITASATTICSGQQVTFTATPTNGGGTPHYEWTLNGIEVGTNSPTYQNSALANGDQVKVWMTSSLGCANPAGGPSNAITINVSGSVTPVVILGATSASICSGTLVTITASPINGGNSPTYQWKLNGNNVGGNSPTYQSSSFANGDVIKAIMTSSLGCASPSSVMSYDSVVMTVASVPVTPSVSITADHNPVCTGATVTFTANPTNGGEFPGYQWKLNGNNVGDNNEIYITDSLHNGDTITVEMNSSLACVNPPTVTSGVVQMIVENCNSTLPTLTVKTYPVKEGDAGLTTLNVQVTLDTVATSPVSVNYATHNDDAIAGLDYVAASGVLVIPAGSSSGTIQLRIIGDLLQESNERFFLNFSNPVNVLLPADPRSRVMIIDDDKGKKNATMRNDQPVTEEVPLKIPSVAKRNQVWTIPEIGRYENEISIVNVQGQLISRFVNYKNNISLSNVAAGLYFYQVRILDGGGQVKFYSGRLLVTE